MHESPRAGRRVLGVLGIAAVAVAAVGCDQGPPWFIRGSARLPDCTEAPAFNLDGTRWYDQGTVTILTAGCEGVSPGEQVSSCALTWEVQQQGNDVQILVDNEYRIVGRLCGDQLYLEGGWWLPVQEPGQLYCTYDEDSAAEVGIEQDGNVLTVTSTEMHGTLVLQEQCRAEYDVTFHPSPF